MDIYFVVHYLHMDVGRILSISGMAMLMVASLVLPVWGAQLDAVVGTKTDYSQPTFKFLRTIFIEYPDGGNLAKELQGKDILVTFTADSTTEGVSDLISRINNDLARELESTIFLTDLELTYRAHLVGSKNQAAIDYKIVLIPKMTNYVLRQATDSIPAIIDAQWRGITIREPIILQNKEYGDVEINLPSSLLEKEIPEAYSLLKGSEGENLLRNHLIDASIILSQPLSKWRSLFDPTPLISDAARFNYKGEKVVITSYTAGESSLGEGIWKETRKEVELNLDKKYIIRSIDAASSANIQIDGFVDHEIIDGTEYFVSSSKIPKISPATNDFPIGVMYGMAGAGGAVAVVILFWSDRKIKKHQIDLGTK